MSKLYRARSLLYRRQILQENIRWKTLDEIYKIYMLLHRSDLNISENVRQTFSHFWQKIVKIKIRNFWILFTDFCSDFDEISSEFRRYFRKCCEFSRDFEFSLFSSAFPSCDPEACLVIEQFFRLFLSVYSRVFHRIEGVGGLHTLPIEWNYMFLLKVWICFSQYVSK